MLSRRSTSTAIVIAVAAFASLAGLSTGARADAGAEIRALLEAGRAAEAYARGRNAAESFGDPAFDFYFGVAAIDAGHAGDGVLALERYILAFPDNVSARMQLARGYFMLGEDGRAREEFEELRRLSPPADVRATIDRFLDAIRLRESRYSTSAGAYVEVGLGFDSNVNGGVSNPSIFLPNLGPVTIAQAGTRNADNFAHFGAGASITHPVAPGISLFGTAQGEWKAHFHDKAFDQGNYNLSGGVSVLQERNLFRVGLQHNQITIESDRFRATSGASAEWQHQLDERQSVGLGGQAARMRYTGTNSARTADFLGGSVTYRRLFSHAWQPILTASGNAGREDAIAAGREDLSRRLYGARAGVSFTPLAKWGVSVGYTAQHVRHVAQDLILTTRRSDRYDAVDGAVSYLIDRNLSLRAEALVSQNRSNIQLYAFPRNLYTVKLRYEFK